MFIKPKTPKCVALSARLERPVLQSEVDEVVTLEDGSTVIQKKVMPPTPAPFPDLGDADCYGIAYQQSRGIELKHVQGGSRVTPMEAINVAEKAIDNLHIPESNEN